MNLIQTMQMRGSWALFYDRSIQIDQRKEIYMISRNNSMLFYRMIFVVDVNLCSRSYCKRTQVFQTSQTFLFLVSFLSEISSFLSRSFLISLMEFIFRSFFLVSQFLSVFIFFIITLCLFIVFTFSRFFLSFLKILIHLKPFSNVEKLADYFKRSYI